MNARSDPRVAPRIAAILAVLARHDVRYVLFGSGAAVAYGADLTPGDLDVCPDPDPVNLRRLGGAQVDLGAKSCVTPGWMTVEDSDAWRAEPATLENFDHLFETDYGDFDIVPHPYGPNGVTDRFTYADLADRAVTLHTFGTDVVVASLDDVIASKMSRRRDKDVHAYPELARLRGEVGKSGPHETASFHERPNSIERQ